MIKPELYAVFRENRTVKVTANKAELRSKLRTLTGGVILEREGEKYHLYHSPKTTSGEEYICAPLYHLEIDPAARIRFEGSLAEHEKLLEEIYLMIKDNDDVRIYSKVQDGNVYDDFFIMDVYYKMSV